VTALLITAMLTGIACHVFYAGRRRRKRRPVRMARSGWYPDPWQKDCLRYWSGHHWTKYTHVIA
jgi:hypothetical protein